MEDLLTILLYTKDDSHEAWDASYRDFDETEYWDQEEVLSAEYLENTEI